MEKVKTFFDKEKIQNLLETLVANSHKIEALESENHLNYSELDEMILSALIVMNWQPYFNEKAIIVNLENKTASYVWFYEHRHSIFTFKMYPAEFRYSNNGYRQDTEPKLDKDNKYHTWIIPLSLFQEINQIIDFHIYPERHLQDKI